MTELKIEQRLNRLQLNDKTLRVFSFFSHSLSRTHTSFEKPPPIQEAAGHDNLVLPLGTCPCEKPSGFTQCTRPDDGNVVPVRGDVYNVLDGQSLTV